jgi:hypothetical protein
MSKNLLSVFIILCLGLFFVSCGAVSSGTSGSSIINTDIDMVPGSLNHSPDGTWWGYNMSKIVRSGDTVFTYVVENNDTTELPSQFVVYKKVGDADWVSGSAFNTSRPGNILLDSTGILHAFVFEATDVVANDSWGSLRHYWFPYSNQGNIVTYSVETIITNDGTFESVNIRVGASIKGTTMAVAFGLGTNIFAQTEQLFTKETTDGSWTQHYAGTNLGHDYYYPYTLVTDSGFHILAVQDDYMGAGNDNKYQKITYFEYGSSSWNQQLVADLASHNLAESRMRLLEQSDLFESIDGSIHMVYKEYLGGSDSNVSNFIHKQKSSGTWQTTTLNFTTYSLNWLKLVEVASQLYYIGVSWDRAYIINASTLAMTELNLPSDCTGMYLYLSTPSGGTLISEDYVDIMLLNGNSSSYPNAPNYHIRIPKTTFSF